jgi:hypothetical protein
MFYEPKTNKMLKSQICEEANLCIQLYIPDRTGLSDAKSTECINFVILNSLWNSKQIKNQVC